MTKKEIRKLFSEKRKGLSTQDIDKFNDLILVQFQKIPLPFLQCVHSYISSERLLEPDTSLALRYLTFKFPDLTIAVPKVDLKTLRMDHFQLSEYDQLEQNIYGIDEPVAGNMIYPKDIDLVIVPLLAFDKSGSRVGYGKGYYDRFLADCRKNVIKVGLSFFDPLPEIRDTEIFDISLNYCCTPSKLYNW